MKTNYDKIKDQRDELVKTLEAILFITNRNTVEFENARAVLAKIKEFTERESKT